ncbi:MAG: helix-turn-helix transcriptional regulator [Solobacterium sp.]|jgi:putative transcriptional regulator|nr:helix-turn-helix transcriptional regulator [Solobacterium sp.]MCH4222111.1 helix-turn-helix transcriptional regulator [Solobacterium sp.]
MDEELKLNNRLKQARTEHHLSQTELGRQVGVSRQTICSIETGEYCPSAKLAMLLCVALDVKFEELFYF